jgi:gamma-glutamyl phosphate reductase
MLVLSGLANVITSVRQANDPINNSRANVPANRNRMTLIVSEPTSNIVVVVEALPTLCLYPKTTPLALNTANSTILHIHRRCILEPLS